eukprot:gene19281-biopygen11660
MNRPPVIFAARATFAAGFIMRLNHGGEAAAAAALLPGPCTRQQPSRPRVLSVAGKAHTTAPVLPRVALGRCYDGKEWHEDAGVCIANEGTEILRLVSTTRQKDRAGVYHLVPDQEANVMPVWRCGNDWLYSAPYGQWMFTDDLMDFAFGYGYVQSDVHGGLMPHAVAGWASWSDESWYEDAGVSLTSDGGGCSTAASPTPAALLSKDFDKIVCKYPAFARCLSPGPQGTQQVVRADWQPAASQGLIDFLRQMIAAGCFVDIAAGNGGRHAGVWRDQT